MTVRRGFPESRQPAMYAWISAGWVLPSLIAPALAGWITDAFGWRWVFLGIIPLVGVAALLVGPPLVRLAPEPDAPPVDLRRLFDAVLAAAGVGAVLLGLAGSRLALSAALVVIGLPIALPALRRLFPAGVLRAQPGLAAVIATRLCATMAFLGVDSFLPLAADRIHGVGPIAQGMLIIGAALAWSVGQALAARWNARIEPRRLIRVGFVLIATGALGSLAVLNDDISLLVTFGAWSVGGFGMGMLFNPTTVTGMAHAGPGEEGLTSGRLSIADSLGFAVMGGIGGAIVAWSDRSDDVPIDRAIGTNLVLASAVAVLGLFAARHVANPSRGSNATSEALSRPAADLGGARDRPGSTR
jgi:MFS family permease